MIQWESVGTCDGAGPTCPLPSNGPIGLQFGTELILNGAMIAMFFSSTIWLVNHFPLVYIFSPLSKDRLPDEMICHLLTLSQPPSRSGWCHGIQLLAIEVTRCKSCARSLNLWTPTEMAPSQRRYLTGYTKKVRTGCVGMFPDVSKGFQKWERTNKNKGLD